MQVESDDWGRGGDDRESRGGRSVTVHLGSPQTD